jgi:hypothetical protein
VDLDRDEVGYCVDESRARLYVYARRSCGLRKISLTR